MVPKLNNFRWRAEVLESVIISNLLSRVGQPYYLGGLGTWNGDPGIDCNNLIWSALYATGIWQDPLLPKGQAHIGTPLPTGGFLGAYYEFLRRQPYIWNSRLSFIVERWKDKNDANPGFDVNASELTANIYDSNYHKYQHIVACWDKQVVIQAAAGNAYKADLPSAVRWNRAARILGDDTKMNDTTYPGEVVICDYPTYLETVYARNVIWFPEIVYLHFDLLQKYVMGL